MFSIESNNCTPFVHIFDIFLFAAELEEPKIGIWGRGLIMILRKKPFQNRMLSRDNSSSPNDLYHWPTWMKPSSGTSHYLFTTQQIFRLFQIESICRQQIKCSWKFEICFGKRRKHCGKRRKCWLPAFFPFPTMFSEGFHLRVVKSRDCVVKS